MCCTAPREARGLSPELCSGCCCSHMTSSPPKISSVVIRVCCCSDVISSSKRPSLLSQVRLQHSGGQEYLNNDTKAWGVLMSGQRRSSCCNLLDGKRNGTTCSNARQYTSRLKHMSYTSNKKMKVKSAPRMPHIHIGACSPRQFKLRARILYTTPLSWGSDAKRKITPYNI